ncbi:MAG TPA: hypothetical protein VIF09_18195 [Polyangiaceae bacterium]|jgi:hypothetical protein
MLRRFHLALSCLCLASLVATARPAAADDQPPAPRKPAIIVLVEEPAPDGLVVRIDGEVVDGPGVPRAVQPGPHQVVVSAAGRAPWSATVEARGDGSATTITAPLLADAPAPSPATATETVDAARGTRRTGTVLVSVGFSVGGAALVVGIATGALAFGEMGSVRDQCPNKTCPPGTSAYSTANTLATMADVALPIAAAGIAAGIVGLVLRGSAPAATRDQPSTSLWIGPGTIGARGSF